MTSNGNQLFVADTGNNRVLVWNGFPTNNDGAADRVLGQADLTHSTTNHNTKPNTNTLSNPQNIQIYNNILLITNTNNSRTLLYRP